MSSMTWIEYYGLFNFDMWSELKIEGTVDDD